MVYHHFAFNGFIINNGVFIDKKFLFKEDIGRRSLEFGTSAPIDIGAE